MATLQVRGIDDQLYKALGAKAAMDNRSVSQEVVAMVREFLGRPHRNPQEVTASLLELAGTWKDRRTAKQIASDLRKARRSRRRFVKGRDVFD